MASIDFAPEDCSEGDTGHKLTFIAPAPGGCNLRCTHCLIAQRREILDDVLAPADYATFTRGVSASERVLSIAIQGYEPLLPASLSYTTSMLSSAERLGLPSSLVTNGTHLRSALPSLAAHMPAKIGVSLDAASAPQHDQIRGVAGVWDETVAGLRQAVRSLPDAQRRLTVISVLMPNRGDHLTAMPELLAGLGLRTWIINPLVSVGGNVWRDAGKRQRLLDDLSTLNQLAQRHGIDLTVDDELGHLRSGLREGEAAQLSGVKLRSIPVGIVVSRLVPSGHISIGSEIGRPLSANAPRWNPKIEHPAAFLNRARGLALDLPRAA